MCLLSLGLLAALCPILGYDPGKAAIILLVSAGMGPGAMARSFFTLCRVRGRQDTEMRIRVPAGLAGSSFGILCLLLGAPLFLVACFKLVEALVLFLLIGLSLRWRLGGFPSGIRAWAGRYRGAFFFAGIAVCGLVYNKLNLYVLDQFGGAYALGVYNAPWEIVDGLSVLVSGALIERVMFPLMATQWRDDRQSFLRMTRTAAICLLLLGIGIAYTLYVEGDRILLLAFGKEYLAAGEPLRAQLPCIPAAFLHNLAACMLISMRLHKPVLLIYISGLACNILLCWGLIPTQGVLGAAFAISGTKLWMMVLTVGLTMRLGLAFLPGEIGAAALAGALAFGGYAASLPHIPREAAELLGLVPLLLVGGWLFLRLREYIVGPEKWKNC
jgi:O-antigen/teichoic acid export membrane protein